MKHHLSSYLPEMIFGENKHAIPARICREDFVAVDPSNGYRILAGRGVSIDEGASLPQVWGVAKKEIAYLERELPRHRRVLLSGAHGPILVFADLLDTTGVLFAVRPDASARGLRKSLLFLGIDTVAISPAIAEPDASMPHEKMLEYVEELFYYMDRIFDAQNRFGIGLWTRTALISNFVGRRLQSTELPVDLPISSRSECERLTAFLICTLLSLRQMDGAIRAVHDPIDPTLSCRVELNPEGWEAKPSVRDHDRFLFLALPAFRDFEVRCEEGRLVLDALIHKLEKDTLLRAEIPMRLCWRMIFEAL